LSSRRRHTRFSRDWSSDVCSSDLFIIEGVVAALLGAVLAAGSVIAIVHFFLQGYVAPMLQTIAIVTLDDALIVAPVLVGIGVLFAGVAAAVAIRRYLKI